MATKKTKPAVKTGKYSSVVLASDSHAIISLSDDKQSLKVEQIPTNDEEKLPISNPYIISIKNASDTTQTIRIFAENAFKNPVNHPYVHVYSADPKQTYEEILKELSNFEIVIGVVSIQKHDLLKKLPFILRKKTKYKSGHIRSVVFKMHMDPYQQQTTIINYRPNTSKSSADRLVLDKNSWLELDMDADDRMYISLYPMSREKKPQ